MSENTEGPYTAVDKAYDEYVKREYPKYGEDSEAFAEECAMGHFMAGYDAGRASKEAMKRHDRERA